MRAALAGRAGWPVGQVELKVAASIAHLGLTARLIAPALAAAACQYPIDMRLAGLWWQDQLGGPAPLSVPDPPGSGSEYQRLLDEVITPITLAMSRLASVSERVLWGNVASAINSAASQVTVHRPDLASRAQATAVSLLGHPRLSRGSRCPRDWCGCRDGMTAAAVVVQPGGNDRIHYRVFLAPLLGR